MPKAPQKKSTSAKPAPSKSVKPVKTAPKIPLKAAKTSVTKVAPKQAVAEKKSAPKVDLATVKVAAAAAKKAKMGASRPYVYANGKRKTAIASVRLFKEGTGVITVNDRSFEEYFPVFTDRDRIISALRMANALKSFDVSAMVQGGGVHAQADAVRHAISKALLEVDAGIRSILKSAGYLTRDSRIKERKKYGLHRARRAPQFSKR